MLSSYADPGEEEIRVRLTILLKTSLGNTHLTIDLTDDEKAEMNGLVEKIFQRYRQALKDAL